MSRLCLKPFRNVNSKIIKKLLRLKKNHTLLRDYCKIYLIKQK